MTSFHDLAPKIFVFVFVSLVILMCKLNTFLRQFCCRWSTDHILKNSGFRLYLTTQGRPLGQWKCLKVLPRLWLTEVKTFVSS